MADVSVLPLPNHHCLARRACMSIAADRRFLVLFAILIAAIVILSLISFEVVAHFATVWQVFHGIANGGTNIMSGHP
jgi:type IV secretory pathway TrbD component